MSVGEQFRKKVDTVYPVEEKYARLYGAMASILAGLLYNGDYAVQKVTQQPERVITDPKASLEFGFTVGAAVLYGFFQKRAFSASGINSSRGLPEMRAGHNEPETVLIQIDSVSEQAVSQ